MTRSHLEGDQVDLQRRFILLDKTKNGKRREIPINDTLKAVFHALRRRFDVPYVFHDQKKLKPYRNVKRSFTTALQRAKITDFHFHDLRHTFASQLVMAGIDLAAIKELLGHKDIMMTLRYAHLAPAAQEECRQRAWRPLEPAYNCKHPTNCTKKDTRNRKGVSPC
jgi:integrase